MRRHWEQGLPLWVLPDLFFLLGTNCYHLPWILSVARQRHALGIMVAVVLTLGKPPWCLELWRGESWWLSNKGLRVKTVSLCFSALREDSRDLLERAVLNKISSHLTPVLPTCSSNPRPWPILLNPGLLSEPQIPIKAGKPMVRSIIAQNILKIK